MNIAKWNDYNVLKFFGDSSPLYLAPQAKNNKASPWSYLSWCHPQSVIKDVSLANHPWFRRILVMKLLNFVKCILAIGWRFPRLFANTIILPIDEIFQTSMSKAWIQNLFYLIFHIMINFYNKWRWRGAIWDLWFLVRFKQRNMEILVHGRWEVKMISN